MHNNGGWLPSPPPLVKYFEGISSKSFLTRGRSEASFLLNAQLSFPVNSSAHGEGVKLSSPEIQSYGEGIKLSLLPKCTAIPHIGKESKLSLSTNSSPKCKAILPHNFTNPSHSICREGFVPIMQNLYKSFPTNESLLFLFFFSSFFILCLFHFILFIFFLIFFPKTWNSSPKEKIYSPAFGGNNRRIDAPAYG